MNNHKSTNVKETLEQRTLRLMYQVLNKPYSINEINPLLKLLKNDFDFQSTCKLVRLLIEEERLKNQLYKLKKRKHV